MSEPVAVQLDGVRYAYGGVQALDDVSLQVPAGVIYGLVGPNGAGKSTTIRVLLNMLSPSSGRAVVLGLDSVAHTHAIRRRVGYVTETACYHGWMTVNEILWFNAGFYCTWDDALATRLCEELDLPRDRKIGQLSVGGQVKVGLVLALAQRPELLILDDPAAGLDVMTRREIVRSMLSIVHAEGGTIVYASHRLSEVERIADHLALLCDGRVLLEDSIDNLQTHWRRLRAAFPQRAPATLSVPAAVRVEINAHYADVVVACESSLACHALYEAGAQEVYAQRLSLEEIFVERVGAARGVATAP